MAETTRRFSLLLYDKEANFLLRETVLTVVFSQQ